MQAVKRALRPVLQPATVRYRSLRAQMDVIDERGRVVDERDQVINDQVSVLLQRLVDFQEQLRVDAAVLGEFSSLSRRVVSTMEQRLDRISDVAAASLPARAGETSTRPVVEAAVVVAALAGIEPPAPVLVLGTGAGGVAPALASLGYTVTALDVDANMPGHPRLTTVSARADEWSGAPGSFAAVIALSDFARGGDEARAMGRIHDWLEPDGRVVLALGYGPHATPEPDRIFDDEQVAKLLAGLQVTREQLYVEHGDGVWEPAGRRPSGGEWDSRTSGLLLVAAAPS